jgi:hypothetical protein
MLTGTEREALWFLKANDLLTVIPANKCNATLVLGISAYNQKLTSLLKDRAYAKLKMDRTEQ